MINKKYQHIIIAFVMALTMSCIMSLVISIYNIGFVYNIFEIWLNAWGFAFLVAFPVVLIITPIVRSLVNVIMKNPA